MIVKTLMYTGIRVSELINIRLTDIDFHYCQVRINNGKGGKDRIVPFPQSFKEGVLPTKREKRTLSENIMEIE